jgi:L-amino acid N-acyltransferase YncA
MSFRIRLAGKSDAAAVRAIYAPIVKDTAISFEYRPPSVEEMQNRISETIQNYPFLVAERDRNVLGYAYATAHRKREAYRWACEVSVFVDQAHRRSGVARSLYGPLLRILHLQGFCTAFAVITIPNPPSIAFHESMGFGHVATFKDIGFKLGYWRDTGWWRLELQGRPARPAPPRPLPEVAGTAHFRKALEPSAGTPAD